MDRLIKFLLKNWVVIIIMIFFIFIFGVYFGFKLFMEFLLSIDNLVIIVIILF